MVVAVAVHPLVPVAVTEYVSGVVTLILAVVAPVDQRKAVAEEVAVRVREVAAQVSVPLTAKLRLGTVVLLLRMVVAVAVQPLAPVAVTEYVPAPLMLILAVVAPVLQRRALVDEVAVRVSEEVAQVSVPLRGTMLSVGAAVSDATVVVVLITQPLAVVAVTE